MLFENAVQNSVKTRHAPMEIRRIKLNGQDRIIPRKLRTEYH